MNEFPSEWMAKSKWFFRQPPGGTHGRQLEYFLVSNHRHRLSDDAHLTESPASAAFGSRPPHFRVPETDASSSQWMRQDATSLNEGRLTMRVIRPPPVAIFFTQKKKFPTRTQMNEITCELRTAFEGFERKSEKVIRQVHALAPTKAQRRHCDDTLWPISTESNGQSPRVESANKLCWM
jgi:hypothetical protein